MKNSIKLRNTSALVAVTTFVVLSTLSLGMSHGIIVWWNHLNDSSFYLSNTNLTALLLALLVTLYLTWDKGPLLLNRCNESRFCWKDMAPNSLLVVLAVVRGDDATDEHLVIIQHPDGSRCLPDGCAILTTTAQMKYLLFDNGVGPGSSIYIAGRKRFFGGGTIRHDRPGFGGDTFCQHCVIVDLDTRLFGGKPLIEDELENSQTV